MAQTRVAALRERFAELPEVVSVVPQSNAYMLMRLEAPLVDGEPPRTYTVRFDESAPEYFKTAGIRFIKGRTFTREDSTSRTVSLVIASDFAAKLFPGHDAVGRRLRVLGDDNSPQAEAEIVGVVDADDTGNSEIGSTMRPG